VVVFGLILGYSRRKYDLASLDETQGSVCEALERGLAHVGGAPCGLLVDNARVRGRRAAGVFHLEAAVPGVMRA